MALLFLLVSSPRSPLPPSVHSAVAILSDTAQCFNQTDMYAEIDKYKESAVVCHDVEPNTEAAAVRGKAGQSRGEQSREVLMLFKPRSR